MSFTLNLPCGWTKTTLGSVCTKVTDGSHNPPKAVEVGLPMLSAKNIHDGRIDFSADYRFISKDDFELENKRTDISQGNVLLTIVGALGRSAVVSNDAPKFCVQRSVAVLAPVGIDSKYLHHFLSSPETQKWINDSAKGTAQKGIYLKALKDMDVVVCPLAEQKQIAAKLDELLAQVDTIKTRLDTIPHILKRFRQSVLAAAVSGKLTEDWRVQRNFGNWLETTLNEVCIPGMAITYGVIKLGGDDENGIPCLRTSNVRWLSIDFYGIKKISKAISDEYSRTILKGNEILVNVRGTLGGVSIVTDQMAGWNVSREVAVVPVDNKKAASKFIAFLIASNDVQRWLGGVQKGVAYTGINLEDLRELPLRLPPLEEQTEIVRRVEQLFAYADQIEQRVKDAQSRVNHLTQSILAKAFRGELTAEWRAQNPDLISGENSAEALLARIRTEREVSSVKVKSRSKLNNL